MFFIPLVASTLLLGPVLALVRIPGVAQPPHQLNGKLDRKRGTQSHLSCGDDDIQSALSDIGTEASSFCSSYLDSFTTTTTTTSAEPTDFSIVTVTETDVDVVTIVVTHTSTNVIAASLTPIVPAFVAPFTNDDDDDILSSNCVCFLDSSTTTSSPTTLQTSTIKAECVTSSDAVSAWFVANTTTTAGPTNAAPTSTSANATSTAASAPSTSSCPAPIVGCIFGTYVLDYSPVSTASQCTTLCQGNSSCYSYQVGTSEDANVLHCNLLDVDAKTAYDKDGSTTYSEYCHVFYIYEARCPVIPGFP